MKGSSKDRYLRMFFTALVSATGMVVAVPATTWSLKLAYNQLIERYATQPLWAVAIFIALILTGPALAILAMAFAATVIFGVTRLIAEPTVAADMTSEMKQWASRVRGRA